jgi:hypothetical protein
VTVTFAPTATGSYSGSLVVAGVMGSQIVTLTGTGTAVVLAVTPTKLAFGSLVMGDDTTLPITVSNATAVSFGVKSIVLTGASFSQTNNCPATLAAGSSCIITVQFAPSAVRTYSGRVTVTDGTGRTYVVTLSGTGLNGGN